MDFPQLRRIYSSTVSLPPSYIEIKVNLLQALQFRSCVHHLIFRLMEVLPTFQNSDKIMLYHTSLFESKISHDNFFSRISTMFVQWFTIKIANL